MPSESGSSIRFAPGFVYHGREGQITHRFSYPILYLYFSVKEEKFLIDLLKKKYKSLISFDPKSYLFSDHGSLESGIRDLLKRHCDYMSDEIYLQTLPKMLGYVFNPVSFWYCFKENKLDAVLCEVRNTFGEKHFYFLRIQEALSEKKQSQNEAGGIVGANELSFIPPSSEWIRAEKVFHVSPFFPVSGHYLFKFEITSQSYRIQIKYQNLDSELLFVASTEGKYQTVDKKSLIGIFLQYGWMTILVIFRIHYQAFWLWLKRAQFYKKPEPPHQEISS